MLEWKILAAAFSALLVVSIVLVGNSGIKDTFGGIVGKLTDWLGGTPISLPGGTGKSGTSQVSVTLYPKNFTLKPETKLNLTLGGSYFENFNGDVSFDFQAGRISLLEKGSSFVVSSPIQNFTIPDLRISKLSLTDMKFVVHAQTDITSENGNMSIQGFSGSFSLGNSSIILSGNVTKITGEGWAVG
ncbi:MAG: hypothetical protein NTY20_00555 [Candidatus Aenigmarchaeota archaeon]|nr:hypothetical protein [Candidatus Aenigmarchaeota archaeon]